MSTIGHRDPYVSVAEFKAYPQFLDLNDIIPGGNQAAQDGELANVLLRASHWADNECRQTLQAKVHTRRQSGVRVRPDGTVRFAPRARMFRSMTSFGWSAYGPPSATNPLVMVTDLSSLFGEHDDTLFTLSLTPSSPTSSAQRYSIGSKLWISYTFIAGFANTTLSAPAAGAATSFTVNDPTGIAANDVLRIWEPVNGSNGPDEDITIATGYTTGSSTVTADAGLAHSHALGAAVSHESMTDVRLATILIAMAMLSRPSGGSDSGDPFAGARRSPTSRRRDNRQGGSGYIERASELLSQFRRAV